MSQIYRIRKIGWYGTGSVVIFYIYNITKAVGIVIPNNVSEGIGYRIWEGTLPVLY
jgi:hypothetical protein